MTKQTFFTLGEAAKHVGKSKATLSNAIKTGRLSVYEKTESGYRIDAAELYRVFPPNRSLNGETEQSRTPETKHPNTEQPLGLLIEVAELRVKLESAAQRITDKERVIEDLRRRLDLEGEERRRMSSMLLTYQEQPKPEKQGFWKRLARWIAGK